ncbi:MAG: HAMP domain-containing histidine kinase, partial [Candidatus Eremiobacteraeota bacterium]|nr:HAMP domain-containing histidine kinase [Candidatus Eremiobacteraeota bacterium]
TRAVTLETSAGADEVPVRAWATRVAVGGRPFTVVALRSLRAEDEAAETFGTVLAVAVPLALVLAAAAGYWLTRASLAPAVAMGRQAERIGVEGIGAGSLHERLPTDGAEDELGQLAAAFNALLARVEHAFREQARAAAQQRQFMADASHELRTPVAALTTVADVTLARPDRPAAELGDALDVVRSEGRRLGRIVDELLLLARADAGQLPSQVEPLYLEEVVQASVRAVRALATAGGVTLDAPLADEAPFVGDAHLLQRLLVALLDNAIKYTPPGGRVRVTLARYTPREGEGARYVITVEDTGCGIAAESQGQLFTRFFRADPARTRASAPRAPAPPALGDAVGSPAHAHPAGAGLGLAIARSLAELHSGTVMLASSGVEGSRFVVILPAPRDAHGDELTLAPTRVGLLSTT